MDHVSFNKSGNQIRQQCFLVAVEASRRLRDLNNC